MGNRRSREFRQQQAHDASWAQLHAEPWRPSDPRRADGSGIPRLQIVRLPTFSPPSFWEVRDLKSEWRLYSATVVDSSCYSLTVRGYELVQFDGHKLKEFFERIVQEDGRTAATAPQSPGKCQSSRYNSPSQNARDTSSRCGADRYVLGRDGAMMERERVIKAKRGRASYRSMEEQGRRGKQ